MKLVWDKVGERFTKPVVIMEFFIRFRPVENTTRVLHGMV